MTGFSTSLARDLKIFHRALSNPVRLRRLKYSELTLNSMSYRGITQIASFSMQSESLLCKSILNQMVHSILGPPIAYSL